MVWESVFLTFLAGVDLSSVMVVLVAARQIDQGVAVQQQSAGRLSFLAWMHPTEF
jgi:hypothetical protein